MTDDRRSQLIPPGMQSDAGRDCFDEGCFAGGTSEHTKASAACRLAKTYLSDGEIDAAFALIEHQIMITGCAEQADHLIQRAIAK